MSQYSGRGRGRPNRNASRPGLLGAGPGMPQPGLLDNLGSRTPQQQYHSNPQYEQQYEAERPKQGLLGPSPYMRQREKEPEYERQQSFTDTGDYSYDSRDEYDSGGRPGGQGRGGGSASPVGRLPPDVQQLMQNLGLSKSDMEELSRLPESELSAGNLACAIRDLRSRKGNAQHDRRSISMHQEQRGRRMSSSDDMYDPAEPTEEPRPSQGRYDGDVYHEREGQGRDDAFQTFEQKWYSGDAKEEQNRNGQGSSILRGSRGPAAKSSPRWREDQPPPMHQQRHRPDQPPPMHQQRRPSPHRQSPPPRPIQRQPQRPMQREQRTGLLGDPHDPSTQELDLLAATISKRQVSSQHFRPEHERRFREPERYPEPVMPRPPPPVITPARPNPTSAMLEAQMKAMQVLQTEAMQKQVASKGIPPLMGVRPGGGGRDSKPKRFEDNRYHFTKQEAEQEAAKMRMARGRVLYLRYKAGSLNHILEADIVDLASAFEKVTNILLVQPKNVKDGWYQAFLELEGSDGAAAMLEHFMVKPPSVKGVMVQFQRSNYQTLKLRQDQMNRDIDALVHRSKMKRGRPRSHSPNRNRTPSQKRTPEKSKRTRTNSKTRAKDDKDNDKQKKNDQKPKTTSTNNKSAPKRKEASPSPAKAKVARESPKRKTEGKSDKEKPETKSRTESKVEGGYVLVDEVGEESEAKTDNKKEAQTEKDKKPETKTQVKADAAVKSKTPEKTGAVTKSKTPKKDGAEEEAKQESAKQNGSGKDSKEVEVKTEEESGEGQVVGKEANADKLKSVVENLEQATNMSEALLKIVPMNSAKAIIGDIMEYLSTSLAKLNEMEL